MRKPRSEGMSVHVWPGCSQRLCSYIRCGRSRPPQRHPVRVQKYSV
jgi:hypothetical protein